MKETSDKSAAISISSLVSENTGLMYLYYRGPFLGDNPLTFSFWSLSLQYSVSKLVYFRLSFSMEVSRRTYFQVVPSFTTKLLRLFWCRNHLYWKIKSNNFLVWVKTSLFDYFFIVSFSKFNAKQISSSLNSTANCSN